MTYDKNGVKIFVYGIPYHGTNDKFFRISSIDILKENGSPSLELRLGTFINWMKRKERTLTDILKYWGVIGSSIYQPGYDNTVWDETAYSRMKIEPLLGGGYRINMPYPEFRQKKKMASFSFETPYASCNTLDSYLPFDKNDYIFLAKFMLEFVSNKTTRDGNIRAICKIPTRVEDILFTAENLEEEDFIKLANFFTHLAVDPYVDSVCELKFDDEFFEGGWKE